MRDIVDRIPAASRSAILQDAARRIVAGGSAVGFNGLVGAIEESAAQIGGNAIDIAVDGKTKSLLQMLIAQPLLARLQTQTLQRRQFLRRRSDQRQTAECLLTSCLAP